MIQNGTDLMAASTEFAVRRKMQYLMRIKHTFLIIGAIVLLSVNLALFISWGWFILTVATTIVGMVAIPVTFSGSVNDPNFFENKQFLNLIKNGSLCNFYINHNEKKFTIELFVPPGNMVFHEGGAREFINYTFKHFYAWAQNYTCYFNVYPIIPQTSTSKLKNDLDAILKNNLYSSAVSLPNDIAEKAKDLSEVYLYLYVVENSLRMFIQNIAIRKYGNNYFYQLKIPQSIQKSIALRKENEEKNKWLSLRGSEELFYLDFKDLAIVISENWELFKACFDSQAWIKTKIDELANIRNLVAHNNSFIDQHNKDVLRINYHQILKQIAGI